MGDGFECSSSLKANSDTCSVPKLYYSGGRHDLGGMLDQVKLRFKGLNNHRVCLICHSHIFDRMDPSSILVISNYCQGV